MKKDKFYTSGSITRLKIFILILNLIVGVLPYPAIAGWIITGRYIDTEGNTILKKYFIEGDDVKVERYNLIYSFNLKTEQIILVDPINLLYVKTDFKSYVAKLKEMRAQNLKALLSIIPESEKDSLELKYKTSIDEMFYLSQNIIEGMSIIQTSDSMRFLGYQSAKYNISINGLKKEELIISAEVNIFQNSDARKFLSFIYLLEPEDKTINYQATDLYRETFGEGTVLRRFIFDGGFRTEWQINLIEKKEIPDYEFFKPDLCKELTLDKWLSREKLEKNLQYDDYE